MPKKKQAAQIPDIAEERLEFLRMYARLESKLGGAPTQSELAAEHGGYAEGSERAAVQYMLRVLEEMGLIGPIVKRPPPRMTRLGRAVLARNRRR